MNNKYINLFKSSLIFAVGNIGSKIIGILMIPLYTFTLSPSEFGKVDLITITIGLLIPIFTLAIVEALIKFILDQNYENKNMIVSNGLMVLIIGFFFLLLFLPVFIYIEVFRDYILLFYLIFLCRIFSDFFKQYARAVKMNFVFMYSDIIYTLVFALSNILFLYFMNYGVEGYLYSLLISSIITMVFTLVNTKVLTKVNYKFIDINILKKMIVYSLPLMPNSIMWWLINVSNRYLITFFLGANFNGIYAVANRFPTIITTLSDIFFKAWQISAIEEANNKFKDKFYTDIFNIFYFNMLIIATLFISIYKYILYFIIDDQYHVALDYIPLLVIAALFSSLSSFIGTNYTAMNKTKGAFITSCYGAIVSIGLNVILIPLFGLLGAALATIISFLLMTITRVIDTRKFVKIDFPVLRITISLILLVGQIYIVFLKLPVIFDLSLNIFINFLIVLVSLKFLKKPVLILFNKILTKLKKKQ